MGRFKETGIESEEFHKALKEAGSVECSVCGLKFGQGNKGMTINVCIECLEYFCNDHLWRHPDCSEGK